MCGLAAFFQPNRKFSNALIDALDKDLYHRGPDSGGRISEIGFTFVFRRLAILDPNKSSNQPMVSEDGNYIIIFNGEIYNFKQIRKKLVNHGVVFKTSGDTEVILKGYRTLGTKIFDYLEGMYAIIILDKIRNLAFAARDPFGIKPLYMLKKGSFTGFASEMRVFGRVRNSEPDLQAFSEFLTFKWAAGDVSNENGIKRVEPGYLYKINLKNGQIRKKKFCEILDYLKNKNFFNIDTVNDAIVRSIKVHLQSDVGYSLQLSGGVDSSLISAITSKNSLLSNKLVAYAVSFEDKEYDESLYQDMVRNIYNLDLIDLKINGNMYADALPKTIDSIEGPSSHGGCVALWLLCKEIKKQNKVVLTGEGADELFGGYERYSNWHKLMWQERISNLPFIKHLPDKYPFKGIKNFIGIDVATHASIYEDITILNEIFPDFLPLLHSYRDKVSQKFGNFRDRLYAVDHKSYLESLLIRQDKISMAASVETRVPFVHLPLWKIVSGLPHKFKTPGKITKPILKKIASEYLPKKLVYRRKVGLLLPYKKWLSDQQALGRYIESLTENNTPLRQFCDNKKLNKFIEDHKKYNSQNSVRTINKFINIDLWLRSFSNRPKLIEKI